MTEEILLRTRRDERLRIARQIRRMIEQPMPREVWVVLALRGPRAVIDSILTGIADGLDECCGCGECGKDVETVCWAVGDAWNSKRELLEPFCEGREPIRICAACERTRERGMR